MGCRNDWVYNYISYTQYVNMRTVHYFTEACGDTSTCGFGKYGQPQYGQFRTLFSSSDTMYDKILGTSVERYCNAILHIHCQNDVIPLGYCRYFCPQSSLP